MLSIYSATKTWTLLAAQDTCVTRLNPTVSLPSWQPELSWSGPMLGQYLPATRCIPGTAASRAKRWCLSVAACPASWQGCKPFGQCRGLPPMLVLNAHFSLTGRGWSPHAGSHFSLFSLKNAARYRAWYRTATCPTSCPCAPPCPAPQLWAIRWQQARYQNSARLALPRSSPPEAAACCRRALALLPAPLWPPRWDGPAAKGLSGLPWLLPEMSARGGSRAKLSQRVPAGSMKPAATSAV